MSDLTPITEMNKDTIPQTLVKVLTLNWIFSTKLEKLILTGCVGWTLFSIIKFLINFF